MTAQRGRGENDASAAGAFALVPVRARPAPAARPPLLSGVMAAPVTRGAATRGQENGDRNPSGAAVVSNEGE